MGQSASGIECDLSGGKFGPFEKQLFVGDQTHSTVMRVFLEKSERPLPGRLLPVPRRASARASCRCASAPDGSLFVGGTNRGWGSRGNKPFAIERLVWTGKVPFEIHEMRAKPDGFELTFTKPVDPETAGKVESYVMKTLHLHLPGGLRQSGGRRDDADDHEGRGRQGRKSVRLYVDGLQEGHIHDLNAAGVRSADGLPLLHPQAYYTLNYIPK